MTVEKYYEKFVKTHVDNWNYFHLIKKTNTNKRENLFTRSLVKEGHA